MSYSRATLFYSCYHNSASVAINPYRRMATSMIRLQLC